MDILLTIVGIIGVLSAVFGFFYLWFWGLVNESLRQIVTGALVGVAGIALAIGSGAGG